ncbi:GNAT family N-acetyltransferase [Daejeonia sp. YH14]|uniref:GNAT family N-acetyltransferase n=1 Tax=Daejeonia sp. YH14 TaxID=3439042 RepID=UPI003F499ABF
MQNIIFRPALEEDAAAVWDILRHAIERRRKEGSAQWQDGYPNPETVQSDISKNHGFVLTVNGVVAVYAALIFNDEPAYENITGKWLSEGDFLVMHRVAVSEDFLGKGLVRRFFAETEYYCRQKGVSSIKVDTNFDNAAMLALLQKTGYTFCGEVMMRGSSRKAFEKRI